MKSILKREFKSYFISPLGYVFIAISFFASGIFFFDYSLSRGSTDISGVYQSMYVIIMIMIPILSMRLMADDKKHKTDQLLLTSPINLFGLVFGKFLAAYFVFMIATAIIPIYAVATSFYGEVSWKIVFGYHTGFALTGGVYVALGILISSLTENQMIAAIVGIILNIVIFLMNYIVVVVPIELVKEIIRALSIFDRFSEFTLGIFSLSGIMFFLSLIFVFLFITVRILERRRWA
ncbi:MAG: ABC transporter permease [Eubacterium sp.]|jgi:ABC-2 type transport system permease protein|nr:ABC transporter permease [Eubacterium sp.]